MSTRRTVQRAFETFPYPSVIVMSPHPDDSALACGGLITKLRQAGPPNVRISILVATTGFRGVDDEDIEEHRLRRHARHGLAEWLGLDSETSAGDAALLEAVKAKMGSEFADYGEGNDAGDAGIRDAYAIAVYRDVDGDGVATAADTIVYEESDCVFGDLQIHPPTDGHPYIPAALTAEMNRVSSTQDLCPNDSW